jgi:hypothetical protein
MMVSLRTKCLRLRIIFFATPAKEEIIKPYGGGSGNGSIRVHITMAYTRRDNVSDNFGSIRACRIKTKTGERDAETLGQNYLVCEPRQKCFQLMAKRATM